MFFRAHERMIRSHRACAVTVYDTPSIAVRMKLYTTASRAQQRDSLLSLLFHFFHFSSFLLYQSLVILPQSLLFANSNLSFNAVVASLSWAPQQSYYRPSRRPQLRQPWLHRHSQIRHRLQLQKLLPHRHPVALAMIACLSSWDRRNRNPTRRTALKVEKLAFLTSLSRQYFTRACYNCNKRYLCLCIQLR